MDHPLPVRHGQGLGDLLGVSQGQVQGKRALLEALGQRLALEALHDEECHAVLLADVVEGADVRMAQPGDGPRLALEALEPVGLLGRRGGKNLEGDGAVEPRVPRAVDLAHASRAQGREDLVRAEARPGRKWHGTLADYTAGPPADFHRRPGLVLRKDE